MLAQLRVHNPEHDDEHFPEQPLHPDPPSPGKGSSISHDVSNVGIAIAATIGRAADAAFLKNERRFIRFSFMIRAFRNKDLILHKIR